LQENPIPDRHGLNVPKFVKVAPPVGDPGALAEAAKMLVAAENPVIICDRMSRSQAGN
jgi:acetolactate synthase I/II/III large subunit